MNLDDIPSGSLCVLDTNILIYAEQRASLQSERLMRRIEEQDVIGMLPQPVWQETMHRLMIIEAIMLGHIRRPNPARQLAEKPDVVKKLTIYRDKIRALMTLGLGFEPCHEGDLLGKALEIQERHGLLTKTRRRPFLSQRTGTHGPVIMCDYDPALGRCPIKDRGV